jgi:hypothetical protein
MRGEEDVRYVYDVLLKRVARNRNRDQSGGVVSEGRGEVERSRGRTGKRWAGMSHVRLNGNSEGWTKEALRANEGMAASGVLMRMVWRLWWFVKRNNHLMVDGPET